MNVFYETDTDSLSLDYVSRCIADLKKLESSSANKNGEITAAITICEAYRQLLPEFEPSIEYDEMPEQD
ncbi:MULTISPECIES: hypothetical protein [Nostocales]|uniref:Uncharacterized protein n=2 Tax=Tolypothrix TaxID=111782 RepID=A0A0C1QWN2_9CYAN